MKHVFLILALLVGFTSITAKPYPSNGEQTKTKKMDNTKKEIYFAGGCFWGTEHFMKQIDGVESTTVGYANGHTKNPTYEEVCTGNTGFAETVKVEYDPQKVDLNFLIDLYFKTIDPTSLNRQGNDTGSQYRTGIYYVASEDEAVIAVDVAQKAKQYNRPIQVEVKPLQSFYKAENYHQDYLDKHPGGYCHIDPSLFDLAKKAKQIKK